MSSEYSLSKASWHTDRIKRLQDDKPISPTQLQIDLEAYCNDNCSFCSYRAEESHNAKGLLKLINQKSLPIIDNFKPIGQPTKASSLPLYLAIDLPKQIYDAGIPAVTFTGGGESTLWPAYDEIVKNLIDYKIQIGLITNGSSLSDHRIEQIVKHYTWVRISIDAASPETHRLLHQTKNYDFDRRIKIISKLVEKRKEFDNDSGEGLTIGVSYVITDNNFHEIEKACELYSSLGVDYIRFSFMYVEGVGVGKIIESKKDEAKKIFDECIIKYNTDKFTVSPATYKLDTYSHENDDFGTCYMQHFVWALGADCKVYPCCIQKYIDGWEFGDVRNITLKEMVTKAYSSMRNIDVKKCPPCWMRDRNKSMINAIKKPKHVNFI